MEAFCPAAATLSLAGVLVHRLAVSVLIPPSQAQPGCTSSTTSTRTSWFHTTSTRTS